MNAIDAAIHTTDTKIKTNIDGTICEIPAHQNLMSGQTQQCFKLSLIKKGNHDKCKKWDRTIYRKYRQSRRSDFTWVFKRKQIDVSEKSTFDAAFRDVFKKMEGWTL